MGAVEEVWPSLWLLVAVVLSWGVWRVVAARTTLSVGTFARLFAVGAIACTLVAIVLELLIARRLGFDRTSYTLAPLVEEVAKALPILLLVLVLDRSGSLSLADAALGGATVGLGFQFVESNLRLLTAGSVAGDPAGLQFGLPGYTTALNPAITFPGHAVETALVGVAAGAARRLLGVRPAIALSALALAWVVFDHATYNWAVAQQLPLTNGYTDESGFGATVLPPGLAGALYRLDLKGFLELPVLLLALLAGMAAEGRRVQSAAPPLRHWLLPGEGAKPNALTEEGLIAAALADGVGRALALSRYFRHRRSALLLAEAERNHAFDSDPALVQAQRVDVVIERAELEAVTPPRLARSWAQRAEAVGVTFANHREPLLLAVAFLLFFLLGSRFLVGPLARVVYSPAVAVLLTLVAIGYVALRLVNASLLPARSASTERLAAHWSGVVLLGIGVLDATLLVVGSVLPTSLVGSLAYIVDGLSEWTLRFQHPEVLYALAALLGASLAPAASPPRLRTDLLFRKAPKHKESAAIEHDEVRS